MSDDALLDAARDLIQTTTDPVAADLVEQLSLRLIEQGELTEAMRQNQSVTLELLHRAQREIERFRAARRRVA